MPALKMITDATAARRAISVGVLGNAAELVPELVRRGVRPDAVTDQTSAHDLVNGYLPIGWTVEQWLEMRTRDPAAVTRRRASAPPPCTSRRCSTITRWACRRSTTATTSARSRTTKASKNAFAFPGFVPAYIRPLFCRGVGPFRWVALSGDPEDIYRTDAKVKELIPDDPHLHRWLDMARERISFQGLPARICWVGLGQRHRLGLAFNEMVASGELKAPIVIGRDHLDSGSVASPNRETEGMKDGSDAVSDWPLLNALLNTASGATWVSIHHGGGVGMGYSQHAGVVIVCDGTPAAARRIERVLWNDPAIGVARHADAGYQEAIDCARENKLNLPMLMNLYEFHRGTPPLLISIPHSGTELPEALAHRFTVTGRGMPDTDWHVHLLYDFARGLGASIITANYSRYVVDLNRSPDSASAVRRQSDLAGLPDADVRRRLHLHDRARSPTISEIAARSR